MAKYQFDGLTRREREVAVLIAQAKTNREMADTLIIGMSTVETHVTNILHKLGFASRVQIATWAVSKGLSLLFLYWSLLQDILEIQDVLCLVF